MKLSKALSAQRNKELHFPVLHMNGYAGEQDGDTVSFVSGSANNLEQADRLFPDGLPNFVRVHWSRYHPDRGWEFALGVWRSHIPYGWRWPRGLY